MVLACLGGFMSLSEVLQSHTHTHIQENMHLSAQVCNIHLPET